jgi:thioredoxin-like negative regulator of GroEL
MSVLQMTGDSADRILDENPFVIIEFCAPWCAPCRAYERVFDAVAARHPEITFCRVDIEQEKGLAEAFEVRSIPITAVLRDHVLLLMQPGTLAEPMLEDIITRARAVDTDALRAEMGEETT